MLSPRQSNHQVPCKGTGIFQKKGIVGFEIRIVHAPQPQFFWGSAHPFVCHLYN